MLFELFPFFPLSRTDGQGMSIFIFKENIPANVLKSPTPGKVIQQQVTISSFFLGGRLQFLIHIEAINYFYFESFQNGYKYQDSNNIFSSIFIFLLRKPSPQRHPLNTSTSLHRPWSQSRPQNRFLCPNSQSRFSCQSSSRCAIKWLQLHRLYSQYNRWWNRFPPSCRMVSVTLAR